MGRILKDVPTDADLRDVFTGESQARTEESHKIITLKSLLLHCPVSQRSRSSLVKYPFCVSVFDKDRSGFASSSEIKTVMANLGVHFTDEEIQEMMIEV